MLAFKGRQREVWKTGYTELFFLDEVTALAAGHRPCCECRRGAARGFQAAVSQGRPGRSGAESRDPQPAPVAEPVDPGSRLRRVRDDSRGMSLAEIDARLHAERRDGRAKRLHRLSADSLPDGAMMAFGKEAFALRGEAILPWSPAGYGPPQPRPSGFVDVLTPPLTLAALAGGYAPLWHPTAPRPAGNDFPASGKSV